MKPDEASLNEPFLNNPEIRRARRQAMLILTGWTLLVCASLYWNLFSNRQAILDQANEVAMANLNKDKVFRFWVASHGVIFVQTNAQTPPNPYLAALDKENSTTTTDGRKLTLMNPAYAMRQFMEATSKYFNTIDKITSLKPLNPSNAPDAWESGVLRRFEAGERQYSEVVDENGKPMLRAMVALITEKECLACHVQQGYKEGDIRGGLSSKVDLDIFFGHERRNSIIITLTHGLIWTVVCIAFFLYYRTSLLRRIERLKYTQALQDSQLLFKTVADFTSAWVYWRNPGGSLRYVSKSSETICGYPPEELSARPELFSEMVHPADRQLWSEHLHHEDAEKRPKPIEFRIITKAGEPRWITHACLPIYDEEGRFLGIRGSNTDITEQRSRDDLLKVQSRHAAMGEMIKNIAHQWRQPLTTLGLIVQNLRQDHRDGLLSNEMIESYATDAQHLIEEMSTTIDDFRNFFRPNKERQLFSLKHSVTSALNLMGAALTSHNIEIRTDVPAELRLWGYPNEFSQVLLILLTNAKDAIVNKGIPNGVIELTGNREDGAVVLRVRNDGDHIPEEAFDGLFHPYFTTKPDGTGIGLYMARQIIEHGMGGSITAANIKDGVEFTIRCPIDAKTAS